MADLTRENALRAMRIAHDKGDMESARRMAALAKKLEAPQVTIPESPMSSPGIPTGETMQDMQGGPPRPAIAPPEPMNLGAVFDPALTIGTGMIAEPAAGIAGIAKADPLNYMKPKADIEGAVKTIENVKESMTWQPRTEQGMSSLRNIANFIQPVANAFGKVEQYLGDKGYEIGGPLVGAIGATTPTALLMATSSPKVRSGIKRAVTTNKQVNKWIRKAAPEIDDLKAKAQTIYDDIDRSGIVVPDQSLKKLQADLNNIAVSEGAAPGLTKKVNAALNAINKYDGDQPIGKLDLIRQTLKNATGDANSPNDARIAWRLIDEVDDYMDNLNLGPQYKEARSLWQRAKKGDRIEEAMSRAMDQATGFENGLRAQFRAILGSPKRSRGFSEAELEAMRSVVRGTTAANIIKQLGKFGISFDQSSSMLLASLGFGATSMGHSPRAAAALLGMGTAARQWSRIITARNARLAGAISRSGNNARQITRAYLENTPKAKRRVRDLTALLVDNNVRGLSAFNPNDKLVADAVFYASLIQSRQEQEEIMAEITGKEEQ